MLMNEFVAKCFVCQVKVNPACTEKNKEVNLPVCKQCSGSEKETKIIEELLEGLADDFGCGCI